MATPSVVAEAARRRRRARESSRRGSAVPDRRRRARRAPCGGRRPGTSVAGCGPRAGAGTSVPAQSAGGLPSSSAVELPRGPLCVRRFATRRGRRSLRSRKAKSPLGVPADAVLRPPVGPVAPEDVEVRRVEVEAAVSGTRPRTGRCRGGRRPGCARAQRRMSAAQAGLDQELDLGRARPRFP